MKVISLFAGIGGFDLGFQQAGFTTVAYVERDVQCRKLLASKFPEAHAFYDVNSSTGMNLPKCDVLCGGWPCQDLSVAGKRAGLAGARRGLFYQFTRIANELQPTFIVWENVPGLLSSDNGRDMCRVLMEFQRIGYSGCWRTLDAQYLGVAQRRRRVFGVFARRDIGAECCAQILSLEEGMRGHPAPRREAGKEVAGTIGGSSQSGGFRTTDLDNNGAFVVGSICANGKAAGSATQQDAESGMLIPVAFGGNRTSGAVDVVANLMAHTSATGRLDFASETFIVEPGALSVALRGRDGGAAAELGDECGNALRASQGGGDKAYVLAFSSKDSGNDAGELSPTLRAMNHDASHMNGGGQVAIAIQEIGKRQSGNSMNGVGHSKPGDPMFTLQAGAQHGVQIRSMVRRLTPRECERLQGFPDDWTAGFADSTRYRMLGNAVAVPVTRWIAQRLLRIAKIESLFDL